MDGAFPVCPARGGTPSLGRTETRATLRKQSVCQPGGELHSRDRLAVAYGAAAVTYGGWRSE